MTMSADNEQRQVIIKRLLDKGVKIPCPESVEIDPEISIDRISGNGVTIHTGCKLFGSKTLISEGIELGYEAPVTIENCQLGRDVRLKGGCFYDSTFLDRSGMGSGAQIRDACLLEEGAKGVQSLRHGDRASCIFYLKSGPEVLETSGTTSREAGRPYRSLL